MLQDMASWSRDGIAGLLCISVQAYASGFEFDAAGHGQLEP